MRTISYVGHLDKLFGVPATTRNEKVPFVKRREPHGREADRPHAVVGFLQPDPLIDEHVDEVERVRCTGLMARRCIVRCIRSYAPFSPGQRGPRSLEFFAAG